MPAGLLGHDLRDPIAELRRLAEAAGRPRPSVTVFGCPAEREALERHAAAGVDRVLFRLPSEPAQAILPRLERLSALIPGR
jgi:hypothetical protein